MDGALGADDTRPSMGQLQRAWNMETVIISPLAVASAGLGELYRDFAA